MPSQQLGKRQVDVSKVILYWKIHENSCPKRRTPFMNDDSALCLFKDAYNRGIDTWDITNCCSNGKSETLMGRALTEHQIPRTRAVIMTKLGIPSSIDVRCPVGTLRQLVLDAVEASLRRLKTQYIDVLKVHYIQRADPRVLMRVLNELVQVGKVNYLCASNMCCWQLAKLHYEAKMKDWATFALSRGPYNLLYREGEREIYPFCKAEGIGLVAWDPLAEGLLIEQHSRINESPRYRWGVAQNERIVARLREIARVRQWSMHTCAIAWVLRKKICVSVGMHDINNSAWEAVRVCMDLPGVTVLEEEYRYIPVHAVQPIEDE
ncbi:Aldo/keto reductase [Aspergillus sclerotioniger CBS 115572]|uniref:Aldo/keto reductase n=1 Tax=Aspergillus sclerotioniger CBS 115572 TaxID=1450535 RepID=A0A317VIW9_9EURO|nr:Aldo/keto reductase [Aspergillus sclerotioniger CBS 115572]PWY71790.1 Aldo/keto reductase [Aspergillus sclerotioniger CBS 115572]